MSLSDSDKAKIEKRVAEKEYRKSLEPKSDKPKGPSILEQDADGTAPWVQTDTLPEWKEPFTFADLFADLTAYFRRYLVLADEREYAVLAAWTLHTWRINDWRATGPLWITGPINSGKTTVLDALEYVAYHAVRGGSMSNSVMFRMNEDHTPSYLLDESRLLTNPEFGETQAFLNERYKKNGKVWRIEEIDGRRIYKSFKCYGSSAFAADGPPWEAMASRSLVIQMVKGKPLEQTLTAIHESVAYELRRKLKTFSDRWVNQELVRDDTDLYPETVDRYLAKIGDSRIQEIGYPLLVMSPDTGPREQVASYLESLERVHDAEEATSYLSDVVLALSRCEPDGSKVSLEAVRVQYAILKDAYDDTKGTYRNPKAVPKAKTISGNMRTLGFEPTRMNNGRSGILWDPELLAKWTKRYRLVDPSPTVSSSDSSVSSVSIVRKTEATEATEAEQKEGSLCSECGKPIGRWKHEHDPKGIFDSLATFA